LTNQKTAVSLTYRKRKNTNAMTISAKIAAIIAPEFHAQFIAAAENIAAGAKYNGRVYAKKNGKKYAVTIFLAGEEISLGNIDKWADSGLIEASLKKHMPKKVEPIVIELHVPPTQENAAAYAELFFNQKGRDEAFLKKIIADYATTEIMAEWQFAVDAIFKLATKLLAEI